MAIKKIKLPNNTTVDINDARLPAVTASNNGQILEVSSGAWAVGRKITISSSNPTSSDGSNGDIWIVV